MAQSIKSEPRDSAVTSGPKTIKVKTGLVKQEASPFYLFKEPPEQAPLTGSTDLIEYHRLKSTFDKFHSKLQKEKLSDFLTKVPGNIDYPCHVDGSSLKNMLQQHVVQREILPLSNASLTEFRLQPGALPEQYKQLVLGQPRRRKLEDDEGLLAEEFNERSERKKRRKEKKKKKSEKVQ